MQLRYLDQFLLSRTINVADPITRNIEWQGDAAGRDSCMIECCGMEDHKA